MERVFRDRTSTFSVVSGGVLWIDMDDPVRLSWAPVQEIPVGPPREKEEEAYWSSPAAAPLL